MLTVEQARLTRLTTIGNAQLKTLDLIHCLGQLLVEHLLVGSVTRPGVAGSASSSVPAETSSSFLKSLNKVLQCGVNASHGDGRSATEMSPVRRPGRATCSSPDAVPSSTWSRHALVIRRAATPRRTVQVSSWA